MEEAMGEGGEQILEGEDGRRGYLATLCRHTHDKPMC